MAMVATMFPRPTGRPTTSSLTSTTITPTPLMPGMSLPCMCRRPTPLRNLAMPQQLSTPTTPTGTPSDPMATAMRLRPMGRPTMKSDFYNDYSNAFDARHVPALIVPKVYAAEKSGYAAPAVLSNAAYGYGDLAYGYGKPVYGYGNKYAFNYEGDHVPNVVSGNYGDHGYVANLNHGYAPGYSVKYGY